MEYILVIWLSVQGEPVEIGPYTTYQTCQQAVKHAKKQNEEKGFWYCIAKEKKQTQTAQF